MSKASNSNFKLFMAFSVILKTLMNLGGLFLISLKSRDVKWIGDLII